MFSNPDTVYYKFPFSFFHDTHRRFGTEHIYEATVLVRNPRGQTGLDG